MLHAQAVNMILTTPDTDVSILTTTTSHKLFNIFTPHHTVAWFSSLCCIAGDRGRVPREHSGTVWRSSLVDHTGGCSRRHPDPGLVGVSTLEGKFKDTASSREGTA